MSNVSHPDLKRLWLELSKLAVEGVSMLARADVAGAGDARVTELLTLQNRVSGFVEGLALAIDNAIDAAHQAAGETTVDAPPVDELVGEMYEAAGFGLGGRPLYRLTAAAMAKGSGLVRELRLAPEAVTIEQLRDLLRRIEEG